MDKLKALIAGLMLSALALGCTKNSETTVIFLGKESYVEKIENVIPDSLIGVFENHFGTLHSGYIPPNVEGVYMINPKKRVFSSIPDSIWLQDVVEPDIRITLSKQHNRECILLLEEATATLTDTVYITGHDRFFTVYYTEKKMMMHSGYEHSIVRDIIIKGEMTEYGIENLNIASIIENVKDNSDGNIFQYKRGDFFIYKDGDGFSEKIN